MLVEASLAVMCEDYYVVVIDCIIIIFESAALLKPKSLV